MGHQTGGFDVAEVYAQDIDRLFIIGCETVGIGWYQRRDGQGSVEIEIVLEMYFVAEDTFLEPTFIDRVVGIGTQNLFTVMGYKHTHLVEQVDGTQR